MEGHRKLVPVKYVSWKPFVEFHLAGVCSSFARRRCLRNCAQVLLIAWNEGPVGLVLNGIRRSRGNFLEGVQIRVEDTHVREQCMF